MKATEVRDQHTDDLHVRIAELREELFNLRFQLATGQLDNHRRVRVVKQDIARIRTILRERDFSDAEAARAGVSNIATEPAPAPAASAPETPEGEEA